MAFTQTHIDQLKAALADGRGARSMTFDNQTVVFNSIDDMLKLLARMEAEVNASAHPSFRLAQTSKGL